MTPVLNHCATKAYISYKLLGQCSNHQVVWAHRKKQRMHNRATRMNAVHTERCLAISTFNISSLAFAHCASPCSSVVRTLAL